MPRLDRKNEHILHSLSRMPGLATFDEIHLIHNCLPDLDLSDINLDTAILGQTYSSPFYINAITGGTELASKINGALALIARKKNIPMAVGSQMAALDHESAVSSFKIARELNPDGTIWANIGSYADPDMAQKAVDMVQADALQIHLNVPQELAMPDGDRCFRGMIERIKTITKSVSVPVIVKEVGFGIAREQVLKIIDAGAGAVDIGGKGGTNFLAIEKKRSGRKLPHDFENWGIATPISIIEAAGVSEGSIEVFSAGGIQSGLDAAKAIALGANAVGMAAMPVNVLLKRGPRALVEEINKIENDLRLTMILLGVSTTAELRHVPLVISGFTAEWAKRREIDLSHYACR